MKVLNETNLHMEVQRRQQVGIFSDLQKETRTMKHPFPWRESRIKLEKKSIIERRSKKPGRKMKVCTNGRSPYTLIEEPILTMLTLHNPLKKYKTAIVTQMSTEKIGLKIFLHERKVPGEDTADRTAVHIPAKCPKFTRLRRVRGEKRNKSWHSELSRSKESQPDL